MMLKSRKFVVWFSSVLFCIAAVVVTRTVTAEVINLWTVVSALYIGGNTATKFFKSKADE